MATVISRSMAKRLEKRSAIREAFETAEKLKKTFGADNIFDLSIGNPTAPCPDGVKNALYDTFDNSCADRHGYTESAGYEDVRANIAQSLREHFATPYTPDDIVITTGAACALNIIMQTVLDADDEVITFLPAYPAYEAFISNWNAQTVKVPFDPNTLLPDINSFESLLTPRTKMVIVNSPNNPTGLIPSLYLAQQLTQTLDRAQKRFEQSILLVSDEPYRDLLYDNAKNPWWPALYDNTIIVYSFSKSASIAGERIGYLALSPNLSDKDALLRGIKRSLGDLGFVNAPTTAQRIAAACIDDIVDISYYDHNRHTLYDGLARLGFEPLLAQGAFYLLLPAPNDDEDLLIERLADEHIIVVGGTDFGCPGYVRLSFCVKPQVIDGALENFANVAKSYRLDTASKNVRNKYSSSAWLSEPSENFNQRSKINQ